MALPINVFKSVTKKLTVTPTVVYTAPINNTAIILMAQVANIADSPGKELITGQKNNNYPTSFTSGSGYAAGDEIILNNGDVVIVDDISIDKQLIEGQTEPDDFDGGDNGTFAPGSGYSANDEIELSNGSVIKVLTVGGSDEVLTFEVLTVTGTAVDGVALTQASVAPSGGTGFTLTPGINNLENVGDITGFTVLFVFGAAIDDVALTQSSVSPSGGSGFTLTPKTANGNLKDIPPEAHEVTFILRENPAQAETNLIKNFSVSPNDAASMLTGKLIVAAGNQLFASASEDDTLELTLSILESRNA